MTNGWLTALNMAAGLVGVASILAVVTFIAERGSENVARERARHESSRDKVCERAEFRECLTLARGPTSTHYTDQEETVEACQRAAEDLCRTGGPQ